MYDTIASLPSGVVRGPGSPGMPGPKIPKGGHREKLKNDVKTNDYYAIIKCRATLVLASQDSRLPDAEGLITHH